MKSFIQILFLLTAITGYAELQWETSAIRRKVNLNETNIISTINFKNIGNGNIKIDKIRIPCGCTSADTDKEIYKPEEVGALVISFSVGKLVGHQTKYLYILTDDGIEEEIRLEYLIPKLIDIRPKYLTWNTSIATLEPKYVLLENLTENDIIIKTVSSKENKFKFSIIEITKNKSWHLKITPLSIDKGRYIINIEAEDPIRKIKKTYNTIIEIL